MKRSIRVALSFATFNTDQLNSFAILVIACLKSNELFPDLPIKISDLTGLQTAYQSAITAAAQGGPKDTAALKEARDALVSALRQIAAYVQSLGLDNQSAVLSSGFDVVLSNNNPSPLTRPVLLGLDNSVTTQLQLKMQAVANAKAYQVQYSNGAPNVAWQEVGIFPSTRGITLKNLTPGSVYSARVRAIGGSTQYSEWSASLAGVDSSFGLGYVFPMTSLAREEVHWGIVTSFTVEF
jgi:Fibronectin type III domain